MNVLDLFSGIGGFSLGLERAGMQTVAFCERDEFCRAVLRKHWPDVPCFDDIHTLDADRLGGLGPINLVCGGFPCQPFSIAGKQSGQADDRYLWPAMREVIALTRPAWVLGENVTGIITLALDDVLSDLESLGYTPRPIVVPACAVGAHHQRNLASGSLLPTPSAVSYGTNQGGGAGRVGKVRPSLETMARKGLWPTPTASCVDIDTMERSRSSGRIRKAMKEAGTPYQTKVTGMLNPTWVGCESWQRCASSSLAARFACGLTAAGNGGSAASAAGDLGSTITAMTTYLSDSAIRKWCGIRSWVVLHEPGSFRSLKRAARRDVTGLFQP